MYFLSLMAGTAPAAYTASGGAGPGSRTTHAATPAASAAQAHEHKYDSASDAAFALALSNLVEVTQTRSAYGQVMNKRAASGSSSSDSNDRTEPLVGSMVTWRILSDALGTSREADARWAAELLLLDDEEGLVPCIACL